MSKTEAISLTKGMLPPSSYNRLIDRSESLKRDSVMNTGAAKATGTLERKKSKSFKEGESYSSWLITEAPGSIATIMKNPTDLDQATTAFSITNINPPTSTKPNRLKSPNRTPILSQTMIPVNDTMSSLLDDENMIPDWSDVDGMAIHEAPMLTGDKSVVGVDDDDLNMDILFNTPSSSAFDPDFASIFSSAMSIDFNPMDDLGWTF